MKDYLKQAEDFLKATNTKFKAKYYNHDYYFDEDKETRDIYKITLRNKNGSYTFKYGQSLANVGQKPNAYDVLACLTKYDVGSLEDFCGNFGYNTDSRKAEKTYRAVVKEYNNITRLFNTEEIGKLAEIN
ncbi:MAG: hypothetical protein KKF54_06775 [Candidatus Omnitrophica bacterium]|nr:hypothetical protein [Candidatus Omnitrophota bacterium]